MSITKETGAIYTGKHTLFTLWAPYAEKVEVSITAPVKSTLNLKKEDFGYWTGKSSEVLPGSKYMFVLNGKTERPDPASHWQPNGVHEASEVVDHCAFHWSDKNWTGIPLEQLVVYELHVGTFSDEGTFEGVENKLAELIDLGITAIELMPVAQFPGSRNWGYDGVYPNAVHNSYGGPEGLKKLVDACHSKGIAVIIDAVYNHMGPEGNYLRDFGPYFTEKYKTPWGAALNFDDKQSDHVRSFFLQNAVMWFRDYHIDALRLDAVHAILDTSAKHFLQELHETAVKVSAQTGRRHMLIAESDMNDTRLIKPVEQGGYGLDGQWMDDYHHAVHTLITGETDGYYADYGKPDHLLKALRNSFIYNGVYSQFRERTLGNDATDRPPAQFVVCAQNHDQVGNRMLGERLTQLVSFEMLKVVAGLVLLSPYTPLLFMGEEYGEENPFLYFVSHSDKDLVEAVRKGRKEEFESFAWKGEAPDPQSEETFAQSKLQWSYKNSEKHGKLRELYKELIGLRKTAPALVNRSKTHLRAWFNADETVLHLIHFSTKPYLYAVFNLSDKEQQEQLNQEDSENWDVLINSADSKWAGPENSAYTNYVSEQKIKLEPESFRLFQAT